MRVAYVGSDPSRRPAGCIGGRPVTDLESFFSWNTASNDMRAWAQPPLGCGWRRLVIPKASPWASHADCIYIPRMFRYGR